ncbi:MAG: hypothetical protein M5U12_20020 [Verrucomicrobia bacterium]|nr:hypothetical protein [Verrucomicrobiota bacterium]
MNALSWLNAPPLCLHLTPDTLALLDAGRTRTWSLERTPQGDLTSACLQRIQSELPAALDRKPWQPQRETWCALPAGGVVLRRWSLPRAAASELPRLLRLQIETELPLAPDDLAWGWLPSATRTVVRKSWSRRSNATPSGEYEQLLGRCGLRPAFTLAALVREALLPASRPCGAGVSPAPEAALASEGGAGVPRHPTRVLGLSSTRPVPSPVPGLPSASPSPNGSSSTTAAPANCAPCRGANRNSSARSSPRQDSARGRGCRNRQPASQPRARSPLPPRPRPRTRRSPGPAAPWLPTAQLGPRLGLSGSLATAPAFRAALANRLGPAVICEPLERAPADPGSATLRGLARLLHSSSDPVAQASSLPLPERVVRASSLQSHQLGTEASPNLLAAVCYRRSPSSPPNPIAPPPSFVSRFIRSNFPPL